jgi:hypothetical protein
MSMPEENRVELSHLEYFISLKRLNLVNTHIKNLNFSRVAYF